MQRQYRLVETLVIAFLTGALTILGAAAVGLTPDNWKIMVPGIIAAALLAGIKALVVAWSNYVEDPVIPVETLNAPYIRTWHLVPGQICPVSGQWTNSRTHKQATCVIGERMPPDPKGSWWSLTDRTRHVND